MYATATAGRLPNDGHFLERTSVIIMTQGQPAPASWNTTSPVWFDESAFDPNSDEFSVESYGDDLLRYVPLETLRARLLEYAEEMRDKLVQLVNEDYDEFANLSRRLVSVDQAIQELEAPLGTARADIDHVRHKLLGHSNSLKEAMRRRQHASELRNSLELSKSAAQSLANVKALVQSLEVDGGTGRRKQHLDERCKNLDRICGELGRLLYLVRVNGMDASQAHTLKATIEARLEASLVMVLEEQDPSSFATLLHAFSTIGCIEIVEQVVQRHTVAVAVRKASTDASSGPSASALPASKMLQCIWDGLKRDIWSFLDAATSMCGSALPFDFIGGSVLPEVLGMLEARYPTMYSPGNPVEFHQTLSTLEAFIRDLESLCTKKDQLLRFRSSAAWKANRSKWNVVAYFSLLFQDIASAYENGLPNAASFLSEEDAARRVDAPIAACIDAMRSCLAQDVFLASIADKLIRLQLQIFARFIDWVDEVVQSLRDDHSIEPNALGLLYGRLVTMDVSSALMEDAIQVIGDPKVAGMVRGAYAESEDRLLTSAKGLLEVIAGSIAGKCIECLGQIRGILAALRMTTRTPTAPAQYATVILRPLHAFLEANTDITPVARAAISEQVVSKAASQFQGIVEETLATATRTEESLKKLRSRKEKAGQDKEEDNTASGKVSKMMELQLRLDVTEFVRRASEMVDVEGSAHVGNSIDQLRRVVRCTSVQ